MKRFWKIIGITLGSLLGVVLLVIGVALWLVFTPERLTPIVRQVADKITTAEHEVGQVELTFFSTFPDFGLRAEGLTIVNPTEGAQSDTLLSAPEVVATVDVMAFLRDENLIVKELSLRDAVVNAYLSADGKTNFDVFALPEDTTADEDTTAFVLPFKGLQVDKLAVEARGITLVDDADSLAASLYGTSVAATVGGWDDILLVLSAPDVSATVGGTPYADHLCVSASLPIGLSVNQSRQVGMHPDKEKTVSVKTTAPIVLSVNEFTITLSGAVALGDSISVDVKASLDDWQISSLLALLPSSLTGDLLRDITVDGSVSLAADVKGLYGEGVMPLVEAQIALADGTGKYSGLPYTLENVGLLADAHIDLNDSTASRVHIRSLTATTRNTSVEAQGEVSELMGDMLLDLRLNADVSLPDIAYFLPETLHANGQVGGSVSAKIRLSDLTAMRFAKGRISGDLRLRDLDVQMDSLRAQLPDTRLRLQMPNPKPSRKQVGWLYAELQPDSLSMDMTGTLAATLGKASMLVETNDLLSSDVLCAAVDITSPATLHAAMDSLDATVLAPRLTAYAAYDTRDTMAIPTLEASLDFADLQAIYTDIQAHLKGASLSANLSRTKRDKSAPRLSAALATAGVQAAIGSDIALTTDSLRLEAAARYNSKGDNLLLRWNPRLNISLTNGVAQLPDMLPMPVYIPQITFAYSNKLCDIAQSQIRLGNSDFALSGEVKNIGKWLRKQAVLEGELNFVSEKTDVNELLALFSAEEEETQTADTIGVRPGDRTSLTAENEALTARDTIGASPVEAEPFLVPKDVDLALNTHIKEAHFFDETAHDLKGRIYVRNGILVLEEVGFVCDAARMQLTAMYKTPRRDHIYVGLDYHMLDVDIHELIHLIPQIDSMMPMLRSFKGKAEFHLAAETFTNAKYELKPSTIRGAASLFAKDLVVLDNETFSKISKLLLFNKKTENKIDSISAEMTIYKKEIDVYPLCVSLDNYMVALGGRHNLDMTFNYDINVLSPIYLGVNVSGNLDDLKIKLAKCKYAQDFKPLFHRKVDTQTAELRTMIRQSMQKNVK
ncbi:MAG: AsmA-like C-terminal region-containing protein [Paludibacteraceae bacterium]|nr:AsmA-like C-terminal region-containing protein [Paludibacteraceae bacterium]